MNREQHIELIVAMLPELDCGILRDFAEEIAMHLSDERYFEIYSEIDEKYKRAKAIEKHVRKFTEMLTREEG